MAFGHIMCFIYMFVITFWNKQKRLPEMLREDTLGVTVKGVQ